MTSPVHVDEKEIKKLYEAIAETKKTVDARCNDIRSMEIKAGAFNAGEELNKHVLARRQELIDLLTNISKALDNLVIKLTDAYKKYLATEDDSKFDATTFYQELAKLLNGNLPGLTQSGKF